MSTSWGDAAEEGARRLASTLGAKDFVYDPVTVTRGGATREVSDGLLIVGDRGIILQVKSRSPSADTDPDKARRWAKKRVIEATRQVQGTRRTLETSQLKLRSHRGHERVLDPPHSWPGVVLLDVTPVPDNLMLSSSDQNVIVMTLTDWYALHYLIRSTSHVIDYIERVIESRAETYLGDERSRYERFARADERASRDPDSLPVLPPHRLTEEDMFYANIVDEWIDADIGPVPLDDGRYTEEDVRTTVEILDSIPILLRVQIGKETLQRVAASRKTREPRSGLMSIDTNDRLLFYVDIIDNWKGREAHIEAHLFAYTVVRHEQLEKFHGSGSTLMLSRISTDDDSVKRTWIRVTGDSQGLNIPSEIRWGINIQYDVLTEDGLRDPRSYGDDDECACGSGEKFSDCHSSHS